MYENLWEKIKSTQSEDSLLCAITDEEGHEVNIIRQITAKQGGAILDDCIMAMYPYEQNTTVRKAMKRLAQTKEGN